MTYNVEWKRAKKNDRQAAAWKLLMKMDDIK